MRTITLITMISVSLVTIWVASARETNDFNAAHIRQEFQTQLWVKISGDLMCDQASGNTACQVNLRDTKSGRIYELSRGEKALELLNSGNRSVLVEGRLIGSRIAVNSISAL